MKMNDFELERLTAIQELIHAMNDAEREELNDCFVCCLLFVYIYTRTVLDRQLCYREQSIASLKCSFALFSLHSFKITEIYTRVKIFFLF